MPVARTIRLRAHCANNHTLSSKMGLSLNPAHPVRIDCNKHVHSNPMLQSTTHLA